MPRSLDALFSRFRRILNYFSFTKNQIYLGDDASILDKLNYRQGVSLAPASVRELERRNIVSKQDKTGYWLVLSQDCDVTNASYAKEPFVELIFAQIAAESKTDNHLFYCNNPREIRFDQTDSSSTIIRLKLSCHDRCTIPRKRLASYEAGNFALNLTNKLQLVRWISSRYFRAAFPTAFNNRISSVSKLIETRLKKDGKYLEGIYLQVSDEELNEIGIYEIIVWCVAPEGVLEGSREWESAQKLTDFIAAQFDKCDGIDVLNSELRLPSDVSLSDLRRLKRWDFDSLTIKHGSIDDLPTSS